MTAVLQARGLAKLHGFRPVLRGIDLTLYAGNFVVLLGNNGAGKSTLLRILSLLHRPDSGTINILGKSTNTHSAQCKSIIGAVMHQTMHYDDLTAIENLRLHARLHGMHNATAQITTILERVALTARASERTRNFSRGMQQRLALARALLHSPKVLFLDEPFTGLDDESTKNVNGLLREFADAGGAILLSTHDASRGIDGHSHMLRLADGKLTEA